MFVQNLLTLAALASSVSACHHDFNVVARHTHRQALSKRNEQWPPVLDDAETVLVNSFDNVTIDDWSRYYGYQDKLAGYGKEAAQWTADKFAESGFDARLNEYHVYFRYPLSASLRFTGADGVREEVNLKEPVLLDDDATSFDVISQQTFLGYSPSGSAEAEYIYAG